MVIRRWKQREQQPAGPLSAWTITLWSVVVLGSGAAVFTVLWWRYRGAGSDVELDAIRTAGALTVAVGGAVTLLLAARRQRSTEQTLEHQRLALEHQRGVDRAIQEDAAEQRITDLYTRAIEQLGAEKAPVRLGALHALERLAQNNPAQRQTIIDVICAYLRMPYTPPDDQSPDEDASADVHNRHEQRRQELQVRLTAQRILATHLNPESAVFWDKIDLNLIEAYLHNLDLTACHIRTAQFNGAAFAGKTSFQNAAFNRPAVFRGAEFKGDAGFEGADFYGPAVFSDVTFTTNEWFGDATFTKGAVFNKATFVGFAIFSEAEFSGNAEFGEVIFSGGAVFGKTKFTGRAGFSKAKFAGTADFAGVEFAGDVGFRGLTFAGDANFDNAKFFAFAGFPEVEFASTASFDGAKFAETAWFARTKFAGTVGFDRAEFVMMPQFEGVRVAPSSHRVVLPRGWTTHSARPAEGEEEAWLYVVRDQDSGEQPAEATNHGEDHAGGEARI